MKKLTLGILLSVAAAVPAQAVTVLNGSFEDGTDPGVFTTLGTSSTAITDWTVLDGSVDYIGTYWQASNGSRSVDLSGNSIGTLGQTITGLTAGQAYQVTFDVSRNPDLVVPTRTGTFSAGGQSFLFAYTDAGTTRTDMKWHTVSYAFTASGPTALISFSSDASGGCCYGPALDNVRIAAVPESETWAMMLGGFTLLGTVARRRRRSQIVFA